MDRSKRSFVWNYFSRSLSDDSKVVCSVCKTELMYSNSTGTMLNHLKSKHPGATAEASNSQSSQKSLDTFAFRRGSLAKSEEITSSICDMIALDLMPISMIEGAGFRKLMKLLQPEYSVPGRTLMTGRLEKRYGTSNYLEV